MNCYNQSDTCYGIEWPVLVRGRMVMACSGHKDGVYRQPVVRIEVIDRNVAKSYKEMKPYLVPFIQQEIGDAPMKIYGTPGLGDVAASIYSHGHGHAEMTDQNEEPTHVFILWDMMNDDVTFNRMDAMLDRGVVLHTLTL